MRKSVRHAECDGLKLRIELAAEIPQELLIVGEIFRLVRVILQVELL
jgi:hypothetical protein